MTNIPVWTGKWYLCQHFMNAQVPYIIRVTTNTLFIAFYFSLQDILLQRKYKENTKFAV